MPTKKTTPTAATENSLSHRQVLGAVGAAAGAMALARDARAAPGAAAAANNKCSVRVAAVSYTPPFHDHRAAGVNLQALRDMTAKVAKERPDFVCYPEGCTCVGKGFEKGAESAPDLEAHVAEVGKIARELNTAIIAPFLERSQGRVYNSVPFVDRKVRDGLSQELPDHPGTEGGNQSGARSAGRGMRRSASRRCSLFRRQLDHIAAELERQRARLVFWPSMYWGGQLLQHWALRYGFAIAVATARKVPSST